MMYQVIYFDNDGQKQVYQKNLSYNAAVKLWQQLNTSDPQLSFLNYEIQ